MAVFYHTSYHLLIYHFIFSYAILLSTLYIYIESVIYCTYHICFPCINKTASKKRLLTFKISVFQKKRSTFFSHEKHVNQHPQHSHIWRLIRVLFVRVFSALPRLSFFFFLLRVTHVGYLVWRFPAAVWRHKKRKIGDSCREASLKQRNLVGWVV